MTQKGKQVLLKDLSARLPYRVKVRISSDSEYCLYEKTTTLDIDNLHKFILDGGYYVRGLFYKTPNFQLLPYLRPMSSMTEKEKKEYKSFFQIGEYTSGGTLYGEEYEYIGADSDDISQPTSLIDWLLEHHFDFRGLIEKGLALEATKGMYEKK